MFSRDRCRCGATKVPIHRGRLCRKGSLFTYPGTNKHAFRNPSNEPVVNLSSPLQGLDVSFDRQDARSLQGPQCLLPQRPTSNDSSGLRRSTVIGMQPRKRTPLSESTFSASCAMHADAALSLPKPARAPQPTPASHASLCFCKPASVHGVPHVEVGNPLVGRSRSKQCCLAKITSDKL